MNDILADFFETEAMREGFVQAHDIGYPGAPGSAFCYAYIKCNIFGKSENTGIVKGGMGGITQALAAAARARGVCLKTGVLVERIAVEAGRATGVVLEDGTQIRSRIVVSNADPKCTFLKLLDPELLDPAFRQRIKYLKTNAAYLKFHATLSALPDFRTFFNGDFDPRYLAEVKICPSSKYFAQSWEDARRGLPARRPVMEVQIPSVYDNTWPPPPPPPPGRSPT